MKCLFFFETPKSQHLIHKKFGVKISPKFVCLFTIVINFIVIIKFEKNRPFEDGLDLLKLRSGWSL